MRDDEIEALRCRVAQLEELRCRVAQLEELLGMRMRFPPALRLTNKEQEILGYLLKRDRMSREALMFVLYGSGLNAGERCPENIRVHICNLRRKLGIVIRNEWGIGWYLDAATKRVLCDMIEHERELAA